MYLFFDTETTGLPLNWNAPISDLSNWPRMVQLAWVLTDSQGNVLNEHDYIAKPSGFIIPKEASSIHGITTEKALNDGVALQDVLLAFTQELSNCKLLIAHNISFDLNVVAAELLRMEMLADFLKMPTLCTKEESTHYCKIPSDYGYKWPTLPELYNKLFDEQLFESHNSIADAKACLRCFFELKNKGIITVPEFTAN